MVQFFNIVLYQPLFNILIFFYNVIPGNDIGIAILILTILIRIVLWPFSLQSIKSQKALQDLQPKIEEIKRKYKGQSEKLARATMQLYKENKVNPFSSCLPLLIQFPFLIAVYQVFRSGLYSSSLEMLYPFISNPGHINSISLGLVDLAKPSIVLAVLAGLAQFVQAKMMITKRPDLKTRGSRDEDVMAIMNKQMVYFMPLITVMIGISLPGGLILYWFATTLLMILQQFYSLSPKKT
ncbi:MAG: hypothetical protein COX43_00530 [Parcubacteria group bacterium CG23_combo_of_CG06-09_8_20_14_all_35_9]|nr:MAG: hypothetical protein COX43_00530 [Parcubacteria group bacterium CG23_combo_of_CG06-09_8_20_14_all_35_9]